MKADESADCVDRWGVRLLTELFFFWYFWLTIQNTTTSLVRNLISVVAVFISFPWRAAAESAFLWPLGQGLRVSCSAALHASQKKKKKRKKKEKEKKEKEK
jgi:hypothetical protein